MATQVTLNSGSVDSAGSLALKTNGTTTAITIGTDQSVNFAATGQRITGDFSNATVANRVMFQTSTTNSATDVGIAPNGSGASSTIAVYSSSDMNNSSRGSFNSVSGTDIRIASAITGTGTYLPMTFYTGGSERIRVDTSGNVGIGTSSPNEKLQVNGAILSTGSLSAVRTSAASMDFLSGNTRFISMGADGSTKGGFIFYNSTNAAVTEAARIDSSGNLLVGTTANIYTSRLNVKSSGDNNAAQFYRQGTTSASAIVIFNSNSGGTETLKSYIDTVSGLLVTTSDERLKENIVGIGYGLQQISALRPVSFEWINGDGKTNLGFIAQEVETVIPEAVTTLDESMSKSIDNQKMLDKDTLIPVLVKAIQEQQAIITQLQADVAALKGTA